MSALIRKDFEDGNVAVKEQLCGNTIALTTDIWTSRATHKQWKLTTCVLFWKQCIFQGISISKKIQEALTQYDISTTQVSAVVHDEASNAVLAGKHYIA